jgi:hypothetical protein
VDGKGGRDGAYHADMGTSTSWIAVRGTTLEQIERDLELTVAPTFAPGRPVARDEHEYTAGVLPGGWVVLVRRMDRNGVVADPELLKELSGSWRVVGCDEETHVMYSAASEWHRGREVWAAVRDFEQGLELRGGLPAGWQRVRDECIRKQAEADAAGDDVDHMFDIPLELARIVAGYRLESDEDLGSEWVTLVRGILPPPPAARGREAKPWWHIW